MIKDSMLAAFELSTLRRTKRREFLKAAGASTAAVGSLAMLSACGGRDDDSPPVIPSEPTPVVPAFSDADLLNFALNLEYLEAQFYSIAAFGRYLPEASLTGSVGTRGQVTGGRRVIFTDPAVAAYAREIAADEIAHVNLLRTALGGAAVAQPAINIDGGATGAFTAAARAANVVGPNATFDPYASDDNFLLGAYLFEDVGVTAYKGAARQLTSTATLETAAGILAAEAYHAGLVRTALYARGVQMPAVRTAANRISDARDMLDGASDLDEGITKTVNGTEVANIVPADGDAIAYSRTTEQVHNIVYLRRDAGVGGGFFPAGTNNRVEFLRVSGAN